MAIAFWTAAFLIAYIYVGYPILTALMAGRREDVARDAAYRPTVSILIPAHNEAAVIGETLRNKLALDYPADRLEIIVVSDESTDGTDAIVEAIAQTAPLPIRLERQSPRRGKTAGINRLATLAKGDILAFADANSIWDEQALAHLVSGLADPGVGYVTGKMVYVHEDGTLVGDGCGAYMRYENWLRTRETQMGSVVGVDGGIDAMRRRLYTPLRPDQLPDFVQPLKVIEQGYRAVYEPNALLKEAAVATSDGEFSMRVRVTLRALWALKDMAHLMNPGRDSRFALQLVSHKLLRYLAFLPLATAAGTSLALAGSHMVYLAAALAQGAFYAAALVGWQFDRAGKGLPTAVNLAYYFSLLNLACLWAAISFCRGDRRATWTPRKG